ncbi:CDP-diacylglycerol--glycerol-3-phosphate 3-phosphatidyltransferase [Breznakia sp. PF5-3]|uniref:CDP-diacylglycerol--glycerol-3-phosphate 3-phosphatidyltransferase n=1 Tax=unclassified Breznakia TaxID=2623764 RepID=UPI002407621E|nr:MULTISPECIES: CDP-diacylglycerol--glycerol-3-phosphate 3-phosphatidyltransferase [unclassified Breznakia]MDF9824621.1 CDP-diacylglycerol--glycerol-3-phosphate 3-phosphatidyltransferase [Breznakia sp. PM6-1]MDF9835557.1 CDP-diacylglycerol--glycerol-3-phosphate 3-phosphatidyltransferase [Breznakia sp. PF5-3]MDF9837941.1 CDP-diacylglycerol--glycerol-3-phosphate 3-phosphatidyltransferase [Breznakia sp. PFB2-8]MDF9859930.1 CDP-diacylglycerol--glycerol-3-phosphate 3-phosphatidyltransferase [Brezna
MNLPNKISIFRILLIPVIVFLYLFPFGDYGIVFPVYMVNEIAISALNIIILILFAIASITDFIDGYIARKYNLITSFGKFIDPIADKLLVNTLFILLASSGTVSIVPVLLMIWRDTMVDAMRMMSANKGIVVAAGIWGKMKTVFQMVTIIVILLNNIPFAFFDIPAADILVWVSAIISVYSGIVYFMQAKDVIMESK